MQLLWCRTMRDWLVALVIGITIALVGPRLFGDQSKPASEPFAYVPPDGFVAKSAVGSAKAADTPGAKAWELPASDPGKLPTALIVVHHTAVNMQVDEPSLGKMSQEMAPVFEDCTWEHSRHEMHMRSDGARVGLIEGDCWAEIDLTAVGGEKKRVETKKLQLIFPENEGSSIATISFPKEQAAKLEPVFEATMDRAKGVATRVPMPPIWEYGAFGVAGLVLGRLFAALVLKKKDDDPGPKSS